MLDSRLLGDFLDLVLRPRCRTFKTDLPLATWSDYLDGCHARDPEMPAWGDSTVARLRSSVFNTLAEAGYLSDTKARRLQKVQVAAPVVRGFDAAGEPGRYALSCLEVAS